MSRFKNGLPLLVVLLLGLCVIGAAATGISMQDDTVSAPIPTATPSTTATSDGDVFILAQKGECAKPVFKVEVTSPKGGEFALLNGAAEVARSTIAPGEKAYLHYEVYKGQPLNLQVKRLQPMFQFIGGSTTTPMFKGTALADCLVNDVRAIALCMQDGRYQVAVHNPLLFKVTVKLRAAGQTLVQGQVLEKRIAPIRLDTHADTVSVSIVTGPGSETEVQKSVQLSKASCLGGKLQLHDCRGAIRDGGDVQVKLSTNGVHYGPEIRVVGPTGQHGILVNRGGGTYRGNINFIPVGFDPVLTEPGVKLSGAIVGGVYCPPAELAKTGSATSTLVVVGVGAVLLGVVLVSFTRRRRIN